MKKKDIYRLRSLFREFIEDYFILEVKDETFSHLRLREILDKLYEGSEQGLENISQR